MPLSKLKFTPIPAFSSNYIWLIENPIDKTAYVVDPGDAQPVLDYIKTQNLTIQGILITHSHNDHIGGLLTLKKAVNAPVYGPKCEKIVGIDHYVGEGDTFTLWPSHSDLKASTHLFANVMHVPGHLDEHIIYLIEGDNPQHADQENEPASALMVGDTLFSSGCGRMFSGPAGTYLRSLHRIRDLPEQTRVYCAHEYTVDNLSFAKHIEPDNLSLNDKQVSTAEALERYGCSLPTTIALEKRTNPFLRCGIASVRERVSDLCGAPLTNEIETFAAMRGLKDNF